MAVSAQSPVPSAKVSPSEQVGLRETNAMPQLVPPHGSQTVRPLLLPEGERVEERRRAAQLRKTPLDSRAVSDVLMLAMGAYTPLQGFMGHDDWRSEERRVGKECRARWAP